MKKINDIFVNKKLFDFINNEVLQDLDLDIESFWKGFSDLIKDLNPKNKKILSKRSEIQNQINEWHSKRLGKEIDYEEYKNFLYKIGYIVEEGPDFEINTTNVDDEIALISGPQLVVPITNARYVLNAVNARWGSLYDAVYGTDVLGNLPNDSSYDNKRGSKVIEYAKSHLDKVAPLKKGFWRDVIKIEYSKNKIIFHLQNKIFTSLDNNNQVVGFNLNTDKKLEELILVKNNLHIRILINSKDNIGKEDKASISNIILESAVSTILDCEDSVATVDAEDKLLAYKNWLGLMKGSLNTEFIKNGKKVKRSLNKDLEIKSLTEKKITLKSKSLMLIRNVGHLMTTQAILDHDKKEIGEGIMDAMITSTIALHDLKKKKNERNSINGSIYIVKPKMHGPEEVSFTDEIMTRVEEIIKLPVNTIKIGIMDEERRTSINLKECIRATKSRVVFINTGFLDRTGDEIHTSMHAGPFLRKIEMKNSKWINAYEKRNVEIGLRCGLKGRAQIGKGMWAMPDLMAEMVKQKINHPLSGANCAWVPSPTAATLHSMHYHLVDVKKIQDEIDKKEEYKSFMDLISLPLLNRKNLSTTEIASEIENNVQGILGYVVRWVDQGIGCSKVPDINNIGLMEDRATCRISSQALANWLFHKVITEEQVMGALKKMAAVVDKQNKNDSNYMPMAKTFDTFAFKAAKDLIFKGLDQPSGYTEPILHQKRLEKKSI